MNHVVTNESLDLIFRNARTHNGWQQKPVEDALLKQVYDLAKMGPTSANMCPLRIVFVKSREEKERLKPTLQAGNVDKTMAAPVTAVLGMDIHFFEQLPKLFPHADAGEAPGRRRVRRGTPRHRPDPGADGVGRPPQRLPLRPPVQGGHRAAAAPVASLCCRSVSSDS